MKLTAIVAGAWCAASVATAALWSWWRRSVPPVAALAPPQAARPAAHSTFLPPEVLADLVAPDVHLFHIECGGVMFQLTQVELVETAVQILAERYPSQVVSVHIT